LFEQKNGLQILRIQKVGIAISYADRWFPTTSPHHSAKNKIDISRGMGVVAKSVQNAEKAAAKQVREASQSATKSATSGVASGVYDVNKKKKP